MEVASPIEIGPKREVAKPYLDRKVTPWGHGLVNTARLDVGEHEAAAIKEYAKHLASPGLRGPERRVFSGSGCDGKPNLPSNSLQDAMKLNARSRRAFRSC